MPRLYQAHPMDLQQLMSQARQQAETIQRKMQDTVVDASAGGGGVSIRMNGQKRVLAITIDPELVKSGDVEMLQDMVTAAVNEAGRKVDEALQSTVGGMLGGLMPGI